MEPSDEYFWYMLFIISLSKRPYILSEVLLGLFLVIFTVLFGPVFSPIAKLLGYAAVAVFFVELFWRGQVAEFLQLVKPLWPYACFYVVLTIALYPLLPYMGRVTNNITNFVAITMAFFLVRKYRVLHNIDFSFLCIAIGIGSIYFIFPSLLGIDAASQSRIKMKSEFLGTQDSGLNASNISVYCGLASLIAVRCLSTTGQGIRQFAGITGRYWKSWASVACIVASFVIIVVASGSRQGLLWMVFVLIAMCAIRFRRNIVVGFLVMGCVGAWLLAILFFVFNDTELVQRILIVFDQRMMAIDPEKSVLNRWEMYKFGFDMWLGSPIWGNGNEAFRSFSPWEGSYSHSNYIEILVNYGALGFLFYYGLFAYVLIGACRMLFSGRDEFRTILIWIIVASFAILVSGFFIPTFYRKPMVIFMAYMFGIFYNVKDDMNRRDSGGRRLR